MSLTEKHICLVIPTLQCGGSERVMSVIANYWASHNIKITLITYDNGTPFYHLHPLVNHIKTNAPLDKTKNKLLDAYYFFSRIIRTTNAIRKAKPHVVISFLTNMNVIAVIGAKLNGVPIIISERGDPQTEKISPKWQKLYKWAVDKCNAIVVQTEYAKNVYLKKYLGNIPEKIHVIPNPLPVENLPAKNSWNEKNMIAVGRLMKVKGFDELIAAFVEADLDDWKLYIIGEGEQRSFLEQKIRALNLNDRIILIGRTTDISAYLRMASIFVMSSQAEGFPNALCEAMISGLACISYKLEGIKEIIEHEKNGLLVEPNNIHALANAMRMLVAKEEQRMNLGLAAIKIKNKFEFTKVMNHWENLVATIAK